VVAVALGVAVGGLAVGKWTIGRRATPTVVAPGGLASTTVARGDAPVRLRLGRSEDGRPIVAPRAGDPHGPRVLVVGCVHGSECAGIAVAHALERVHAPADLWIVPDLNPDGYARGTRQNGRGVDLNANWSSQWRGGGRPWDTYYPGPRPFSERETRIARNLIVRLRPRVTILVPPAPEPGLGLGAEQRRRTDLLPRRRDALLPPPLAGGHRHQLAEPPPAWIRLVHGRAVRRPSHRDRCAARSARSSRLQPRCAARPALTSCPGASGSKRRCRSRQAWLPRAATPASASRSTAVRARIESSRSRSTTDRAHTRPRCCACSTPPTPRRPSSSWPQCSAVAAARP
jgi:hypothetical protein